MPYNLEGDFLWETTPSVSYLVFNKLEGGVNKQANIFYMFFCSELMMPVWGGFYSRWITWLYMTHQGKKIVCTQYTSPLLLAFLFPHLTQALADHGGDQGSGTGKYGVFTDTGECRVCRDCSMITLVTLEEFGLHVRSVGTGIASELTLIGRLILFV